LGRETREPARVAGGGGRIDSKRFRKRIWVRAKRRKRENLCWTISGGWIRSTKRLRSPLKNSSGRLRE
jgi:hypothetical protein